ncbi:helix-turn-helix domain-containing protein [Algimonas porphyrae]|uniref:HTH araC/xylS-type domain-containing protein n=1 Tax=Algimonas porphyrae TaxID=1128113 RepID=A0ABQ5V0V9_9PROT|nr:AraC family transcriptional regulator [Algimonas porphyrae]GLQ20438.1 hypothetical protein GCM10007854_13930 [Algimonas porphyrae]
MTRPTQTLPGAPVALIERSWPGLVFGRYRENIRDGVEWPMQDDRHTIILHEGGRMNRLESELDGSGHIVGGAMAGEVWSVPQGRRYATSAQGGVVTYAVMKLDEARLREAMGSRSGPIELIGCLGRYDPFLLRAVERLGDYIADNLSQTIRLEDMATVAGMSEHQLLDGFALHFGTTPAQYVLRQRLRWVRSLLAETVLSITDIAFRTGFASHSHLTTRFRTEYGLTPSAFRKGI